VANTVTHVRDENLNRRETVNQVEYNTRVYAAKRAIEMALDNLDLAGDSLTISRDRLTAQDQVTIARDRLTQLTELAADIFGNRIDLAVQTWYTLDLARRAVKALRSGELDGWTYEMIPVGFASFEIHAHDEDGNFCGKF